MDQFVIHGGIPLKGTLAVSGAKNAVLPILCASLLTAEPLVIQRVPKLEDVATMLRLLEQMGVQVKRDMANQTLTLQAAQITFPVASYDMVKTMRASILVLGPLLARLRNARVSLPGGCAIGARPVDQHIKGLSALGAHLHIEQGDIVATLPKGRQRLLGTRMVTDIVTVTGTENLLMAGTLAEGRTIIENAAREPEVIDLAHCLIAMGARIEGVGTDTLIIDGVDKLHGATHRVIPDRIETGTYLCAAAATRGKIRLIETAPSAMTAVLQKFREMGHTIETGVDWIEIDASTRSQSKDIVTAPYPGFPTDMQAQFMAVNALAEGSARVVETIFENRFMHVLELHRLGAQIEIDGHTALVHGVSKLSGTRVMATDLRASASLIVAGLAAEGTTIIDRIYHLDRGYEKIEEKLSSLGARVERRKKEQRTSTVS